jgi:hypothetical protein
MILEKLPKIPKIFFTLIYVVIIILQAYVIFHVFPVEKKLYQDCETKVLCEFGQLPNNLCYGYEWNKFNVIFNLPKDFFNDTINISIQEGKD